MGFDNNFVKSGIRNGLLAGFVVMLVVGVIYYVFKAVGGIEISPQLKAWFNLSVSDLKVWQLLLMFYITAMLSSK